MRNAMRHLGSGDIHTSLDRLIGWLTLSVRCLKVQPNTQSKLMGGADYTKVNYIVFISSKQPEYINIINKTKTSFFKY